METTTELDKKPLNPWLLVMLVAGLFVALVVVVLVIAIWMTPPKIQPIRDNEVEMKDGTILRIEQVSVGPKHVFTHHWSPEGLMSFWDRRSQHVNYATQPNEIAIWMTRHDKSGRPLDFEWWQESVAIDAAGESHSDRRPVNFAAGRLGTATPGVRPLRADRVKHSSWLVYSSFPKFRVKDGRFRLHVKDTKGDIVAEIDLQYPPAAIVPDWQPEPLPITKSNGNLSVTLKSIKAEHNEWTHNGRDMRAWTFSSEQTTAWNGEPAPHWEMQSMWLSDALGNSSTGFGGLLSPKEPAWKLRLRMFKTVQSRFEESEKQLVTQFAQPAAAAQTNFTDSIKLNGTQITLASVGGSGKTDYEITAPPSLSGGNSSRSASPSAFGFDCQFAFKSIGGRRWLRVDAPFPHLVLLANELSSKQRFNVLIADEQGRSIPADGHWLSDGFWLYFFKPEADSRSFQLTAVVHQGFEFEFFVKPPEMKIPEKTSAESKSE